MKRPQYINVQTRKTFDQFLHHLKVAKIVVADTETNGLNPYGTLTEAPNKLISFSVYFPEFNIAYNLPFRHGQGTVQVDWKGKPVKTFDELTWQGKAKKALYMSYWFEQYRKTIDAGYFKNLPLLWMDEVKKYWARPGVLYVFHNAKFDLHVLDKEGYPTPTKIEDTMLALHLVHEDWRGIPVDAPKKWTKTDADEGRCAPDQVGTWALLPDGQTLMLFEQYGNRQLKWQAARILMEAIGEGDTETAENFAEATAGETALKAAITEFEDTLVDFICQYPNDPHNAFAVLKTKGLQAHKVAAKVTLDEKSEMWMLPSTAVAHYAMLDTVLTWHLRNWCLPILEDWGSEDLYKRWNDIQLKMAWHMEVVGFKLDRDRANAKIAEMEPRIAEVDAILQGIVDKMGIKVHLDLSNEIDQDEEEEKFNPNSNPQLVVFLNAVLGTEFGADIFPEWFDDKLKKDNAAYPGARVYSTKKKALEPYEKHPVIKLLKSYRMMQKSVKTYLKKWLAAADAEGMVRGNINVDGTVAGRCASSGRSGNFQNIPDRVYTIKEAIIPPSDEWVFGAIDYGQLELRLASHYAEGVWGLDKNMTMTKLFTEIDPTTGKLTDMHAWVRDNADIRRILFGSMSDEAICSKLGYSPTHKDMLDPRVGPAGIVAKYCRQVAKTMNFGLLYSGGYPMLVNLLSIDQAPAKVLVNWWKGTFVAFPRAQNYCTDLAMTWRDKPNPEAGTAMYITQLFSQRQRKLHLYPTWKTYMEHGIEKGFNVREAEARKTWNNVVQGDGGWICTESATRYIERYGTENLKMFAQIHDALDFFVRKGHEHEVQRLAEIMVDWPVYPPLNVDIQRSYDGTWQGIGSVVKDYAVDQKTDWNDPVWQAGMTKWKEANQAN